MLTPFVHLRNHSAYSLSEGAIKVKELVDLAKKNHMPAVALTDTNNLFGAMEFSLAAKDYGIQPIIGCQLAVINENNIDSRKLEIQKPTFSSLIFLVQNKEGYHNLSYLVSQAYRNAQNLVNPAIFMHELTGKTAGLIALTGGPQGSVGQLLLNRNYDQAAEVIEHLKKIFQDRLYIELMRQGTAEENTTEQRFIELAARYHVPLVATNESFFASADVHEAHDALLCIAQGVTITEQNRRRVTVNNYFKSGKEMLDIFADIPEATANTIAIARRCSFLLEPRKTVFPKFHDIHEPEKDETTLLKEQAKNGLELRMKEILSSPEYDNQKLNQQLYWERLEYELSLIIKMGFAGYFLIVADFIKWSKKNQIPVGPGRGSGAGSVVAWALTITELDPIRWGLLFERFLNPERVSLPDFDVDFCQDRRDEVIDYVRNKYGISRVAQIITFGKLQARAVLRDVGRVLELPYTQVDKLCKQIPNNPTNPVTLKQVLDMDKQLQEVRRQEPNIDRLFSIALQLEGLYRHASTHAAGVVIGQQPLEEYVPLYQDSKSTMPATQFNMKYVELAGLIKFDFLGLKTLTMIALAEKMLHQRRIKVDLARLTLSDNKTYDMLGRGESMGVFQLESGGMRDVLRKLKPDRFEDIIAVVALYRPGPMDNIPKYIACKHGKESADYLHPMLENILRETFGIMIYQEQVMQIAQVLANYSLGKADILRRAMGKKIKEEMEAQRKVFIDGARRNNVDEATATKIFDEVNKFAGYGFNKSHAAAYALVSYQTAWLKANYPVEFFAASMTLEISNTDKLGLIKQELNKNNIALLPPDINRSGSIFLVESHQNKLAIRYALPAVRNVGNALAEMIINVRATRGTFKSLQEFIEHVDSKTLNKRQLESLICAGAMDTLVPNRHQAYQSIDIILQQAAQSSKNRESGQIGLFGVSDASEVQRFNLKPCDDWNHIEKLQHEYDSVGFYLSSHPLDAYEKQLKYLNVSSYADVQQQGVYNSQSVTLAGVVISRQEKISAKGNRYAYVRFSDHSGIYEVMFFSDVLIAARELLEPGNILLLPVEIREDQSEIRLTGQQPKLLNEAMSGIKSLIQIQVREAQTVASLNQILMKSTNNGKDQIKVIVETEYDVVVEMTLGKGYRWSDDIKQQVQKLLGQDAVEEII